MNCKVWGSAGLLVCVATLATSGCGGDRVSADGKKEDPVREVRLAAAETGTLARTVTVTGTLAADEQAELGIKVAGRVEKVLVEIGDRVREGQPLVRLVPTDLELRVEQAENLLAQARARLGLPPEGPDAMVPPESTAVVKQAAASLKQAQLTRDRMARLYQQQLIPQSDLDAAEAAFSVAEARYQEAIEEAHTRQALLAQRVSERAIAQRQLADSTVTAPFTGAIRERLVSAGDYVAVGTPVAVLVKLHPLRLRLAVPERESAGIKPGLAVTLSVEGEPDTHTGRVARISPAISEGDRTLTVEAEVPNREGKLKPGGFVRADIVIAEADQAVLIPVSAIVSFAGIEKILAVEDGKTVEKRIRTGRRSGERVEVLDGLRAGERVVLAPGNLVGGQAVKVLG